jgi:hypothetical protein
MYSQFYIKRAASTVLGFGGEEGHCERQKGKKRAPEKRESSTLFRIPFAIPANIIYILTCKTLTH